MKEIIVKTQKELDKVKVDAEVYIKIEGGTYYDKIVVKQKYWARVEARGNSSVEAWENSSVEARGNSSVVAWENSSVEAWGNSSVEAWENSIIKRAYNSVKIALYGFACIAYLYDAASVTSHGFNTITQIGTATIKIVKSVNTVFNQFKETFETNPDFDFYKLMYPVKQEGDIVTLYKAVHKKADGTYTADWDKSFTYVIGEMKTVEAHPSIDNSCLPGIHVSHKAWARLFGKNWADMAILECEMNVNDIIVAKDCDGKVRTSKLKVIREVPREEWKS